MNAALVVMTILGCNDSGTDCHYIATAQERWPTVAMCDSVSEDHLPKYANQPYPVLISVCQDPETAGVPSAAPVPATRPSSTPAHTAENAAPASGNTETTQAAEVTPEEAETLAGRAIQRVRNVLPTTEGVKTLMTKPVRLVEGGYSWVARKFDR
ncbi:hypothetical protein [Aliirhizobium smilacinae]|uniref:Uncharacterized protein n=1 Tax=Aliirhizobium smilacinae TaxID=1395944 RepID=A0A5C4XFF7_9HYPH|nr:hypothetical protein [Rhizobium smilacinae]TNM62092.1 hypothetical protein FHP24_18515 [Rhizobium smilacinae]